MNGTEANPCLQDICIPAGENRPKHSKSVKCRVDRSIIPGVKEKRNLDKEDEHAMGLNMA